MAALLVFDNTRFPPRSSPLPAPGSRVQPCERRVRISCADPKKAAPCQWNLALSRQFQSEVVHNQLYHAFHIAVFGNPLFTLRGSSFAEPVRSVPTPPVRRVQRSLSMLGYSSTNRWTSSGRSPGKLMLSSVVSYWRFGRENKKRDRFPVVAPYFRHTQLRINPHPVQ